MAVDAACVYWANRTDSRIGRANLNGTGQQYSFIENAGIPCGVAVNAGHVYWADEPSGWIGRANLNGTGATREFIDTEFDTPCWVAHDGQYVYWINQAIEAIGRANLDGTGVNQSFVANARIDSAGGSGGIAVDSLPPPNAFKLGNAKLNKKTGSAKQPVEVSWPGKLTLSGKNVQKVGKKTGKPGRTSLPVKATGKAKRKLDRTGKARVRYKVKNAPAGGAPKTKTKRIVLVKKG